jgi:hypothetical protein
MTGREGDSVELIGYRRRPDGVWVACLRTIDHAAREFEADRSRLHLRINSLSRTRSPCEVTVTALIGLIEREGVRERLTSSRSTQPLPENGTRLPPPALSIDRGAKTSQAQASMEPDDGGHGRLPPTPWPGGSIGASTAGRRLQNFGKNLRRTVTISHISGLPA